MERDFACQIVMATHSPVMKSYRGATLPTIDRLGLKAAYVRETEHCRLFTRLFEAPETFVEEALEG